jgi:hypothetical protein
MELRKIMRTLVRMVEIEGNKDYCKGQHISEV